MRMSHLYGKNIEPDKMETVLQDPATQKTPYGQWSYHIL